MGLVRAGAPADIPQGRSRRFTLEGEDVTVWNAGGTLVAMNTCCPHQHIPALHQGVLSGMELTCPMHGWTFSLATGRAAGGTGRLTLYPVHVRGGELFVEMPDV